MKRGGLIALIGFGVAFGMVEATVVTYLRLVLHISSTYPSYAVVVNLGILAFIRVHDILGTTRLTIIEMWREVATLIMIGTVAWIAAKTVSGKIGAFLVVFATWDIAYYGFLRVLTNWPSSLMSRDIFFLLPAPSVGPVLTAIGISLALFVSGLWLYLKEPANRLD